MLFRIDQYFDFIIDNTRNSTWQKRAVQSSTSMVVVISCIFGNSVSITNQNSFNDLVFLFDKVS